MQRLLRQRVTEAEAARPPEGLFPRHQERWACPFLIGLKAKSIPRRKVTLGGQCQSVLQRTLMVTNGLKAGATSDRVSLSKREVVLAKLSSQDLVIPEVLKICE